MKPKDLKPVFTWSERRVLIQDRVWYFPDYHNDTDFTFPGWGSELLFGNDNPVHVEYCSGNGAWIEEKALAHPELNWVAVEKQFKRVRKIWSKIQNQAITNLFVVCGEGLRWTEQYLQSASISGVYINFPDPWPKDRHAKHRIITPRFGSEIQRILKPEGEVMAVTDDPGYSAIMAETFCGVEGLTPCYPDPYYINSLKGYGSSFFDALWREKGKEIRYHLFKKG